MATTLGDMTRLLIVQTGDFGAAWTNMTQGLPETYRDQHASVRFVAGLAPEFDVTTLAVCKRSHDEMLAAGLRSIGVQRKDLNRRRVADLFDRLQPDRLILRSPLPHALAQAQDRGLPTLPCFADIFSRTGLRGWLRTRRLAHLLSGPHIPGIANHSLNASRSVVEVLGVSPHRVIPWDWSAIRPDPVAKAAPANPTAPRAFYAGALSAAKGLGDCFDALAILRRQGLDARLGVAGSGDPAPWRNAAADLGISDAVDLMGLVPNAQVRRLMSAHDLVIVPSRHDYPEGLPNTIYEGLASRSPLIVSDHPAFRDRIVDGHDGLVFAASDPVALAGAITRLMVEPGLYGALSDGAGRALGRLHVGLEWADLVRRFLDDPDNHHGWVQDNSLAGLGLA